VRITRLGGPRIRHASLRRELARLTNVVLAGHATTVPFTAVLAGPQRTITDNAQHLDLRRFL
jgi:hypothetical protein